MANILCFQQLYDALAMPVRSTTSLRGSNSAQTSDRYMSFCLQNANGVIGLCSDDGVEFAVLDLQTASKLQNLNQIEGTHFEAVVEVRSIAKRRVQSKKPISLTVNILGPRKAADEVSLALSRINVFLQHPQALDSSVDYYNPELLVFPGDEPIMRDYIGVGTPSWKHEHLLKDIEKIFGSLGQDIGPEGDKFYPIDGLKSALTKYGNTW